MKERKERGRRREPALFGSKVEEGSNSHEISPIYLRRSPICIASNYIPIRRGGKRRDRSAMDREPEELQFLGAFGILKEAFKILRSCGRLLNLITVTLIVPLSFVIFGQSLISVPLFNEVSADERELQVEAGSRAGERTLRRMYLQWPQIFLFKLPYLVFLLAFSLLSTAAVVYTVACMYTAKDLSYGKVMAVVPKVWKRLMATFLLFFAITLAYKTAFVFVVVFLILGVGVDNLNPVGFVAGLLLLLLLLFVVDVYISAIWHLASVISVLEDKYGVGAMKKSRHLIAGKWGPALVLILLYFVVCGSIGSVFGLVFLRGNRRGVGVVSRAAYAAILIALLSFVNLMALLVQSVFYFVCKSYHHQSIDKSALSDHLEVYLGEYVRLKGSVRLDKF